ncbi:MAG: NosD domain-containing protein [Promethearchaeota archaeon]
MKTQLKILFPLIIFTVIFLSFTQNFKNLNIDTDIFHYNSQYNINYSNLENLRSSAIWGKIHIKNNWTATKEAGICTGNGTFTDPYIIQDLIIDGGNLGNCIKIENSSVYFKIENCTFYNSGGIYGNAGIFLSNVNNSQLINNNCSFNFHGMFLSDCYNNTVLGNILDKNNWGINSFSGINNNFSQNTINNSLWDGINLFNAQFAYISDNNIIGNIDGIGLLLGFNNTIYANTVNKNEIGLYIDSLNNIISGNIAINNDMHGILLYGENDIISGNTANYNGDSGIVLSNCNKSKIIGNIANYNTNWGIALSTGNNNSILVNNLSNNDAGIYLEFANQNNLSGNFANTNNGYGIFLTFSDSNIISGNTANNNKYGIFLHISDNNIISGNTLIGNIECIFEENCQGNKFSDNGDCIYGQSGNGRFPIEVLLSSIFIGVGILISIVLIFYIVNKRKRIKQ